VVERLLDATRQAAGRDGTKWDWRREERNIREMYQGAVKKFGARPQLVNLEQERAKREPAETPDDEKTPAIIKIGKVAVRAWGKPLITVGHELWTYERGAWQRFDADLKAGLKRHIQSACKALKKNPSPSSKHAAYSWIEDDIERHRPEVIWDGANVIVTESVTYEIATGAVREHREQDYATRRVACTLDFDAGCPTWLAFLESSLDPDVVDCLREWFGSALVRGKTRETTKGLIVYGPSRSGKTQVAQVLRALVGGQPCGLQVADLDDRFALEPFLGKSGWIADDAVGQREEINPELYKKLVTGEPVSVARKGLTSVETSFDFPVLLTANNLPKVKDDSDAVYNRSLVLPMQKVRAEDKAAERPIFETVIETELAGVLNWAIAGWKQLRERKRFAAPPSMVQAGETFRSDNSPVAAWVQECVEADPDMMVDRRDLLASFHGYMVVEFGSGTRLIGSRTFIPVVRQMIPGVEDKKAHRARCMAGLKLTEIGLEYLDERGKQAFNEAVGSGRANDEVNQFNRDGIAKRMEENRQKRALF
jgi:P4 family phage/plasmid primase-like protien